MVTAKAGGGGDPEGSRGVKHAMALKRVVGARGFEPPTSWSRTKRATKLRYAPEESGYGEQVTGYGKRERCRLFPVTSNLFPKLVGTARFELATPCTPSKCATRLRHVPILE